MATEIITIKDELSKIGFNLDLYFSADEDTQADMEKQLQVSKEELESLSKFQDLTPNKLIGRNKKILETLGELFNFCDNNPNLEVVRKIAEHQDQILVSISSFPKEIRPFIELLIITDSIR